MEDQLILKIRHSVQSPKETFATYKSFFLFLSERALRPLDGGQKKMILSHVIVLQPNHGHV